ncbi:uncharacterized protein LOC117650700 [Thrips palmi]|uniref:RNA-directed DNA polymerase n=1 Tax=Thrips palmi TaxID=161013 RepID=A0A6P8ZYH3_THRPL|nr:uncharacterized protein LOC117650700 [Thrips palmi]
MPFGLSAAPGVFQTVTDRLMRPSMIPTAECDLGDPYGVYLDDICVAGDEFQYMLQKTYALFNRVRASQMKLKAKKCFLFKRRLEFLGFVLTKDGISANEDKVARIVHWPVPLNRTELRSWLGLAGFYSRFIDHMADIAAVLYDLLRDCVPFVWSPACQEALDRLKTALTTAPVLGVARADKGPFSVHCDASQRAVACILSQEQDGRQVVLHYHSRKMPTNKRPLCATHVELYALVEATRAFRLYLLGRTFFFYTDHYALQWLRSFKHPEGKLARWLMRLEEFRFEIRHMKGKDLTNADALSRRPDRPCSQGCKTCERMEQRDEERDKVVSFLIRQVSIVNGDEWQTPNLAKAQQCDPDLKPIYDAVKAERKPRLQDIVGFGPITRSLWVQFKSLVLQSGVLKRCFEHSSGDPELNIYQIVVPEKQRKELVLQYHTSPSSGSHFGVSKCYNLLKERFYWPDMNTTVRDCKVHKFTKDQIEQLKVKQTQVALKRKSSDAAAPDEFFKKRVTQSDVDRATDNLIIRHRLPHSIVDSEVFQNAILLGCPSNVSVGRRQTFRKRLDKHYEKMKKNLTEKLKKVRYVATTADGWSKFRRGFLGMTVSWIDPDTMQRERAGLALTRLKGSHTHEKLAYEMSKINETFGISSKTTKCTTDSAANYRKAFTVFSSNATNSQQNGSAQMDDEEEDEEEQDLCEPISLEDALDSAELDGVTLPDHQRCAAHIINLLATTDAKEALTANASYKKLHDSTETTLREWWRKQSRSELVSTAIQDGFGVKLEVSGETRWNSEFDAKLQIVRLIDKDEEKFKTVIEGAGLTLLTSTEIKFLREFVHVMQPVAMALDILQRDKNMFAGYLIPTVLSMEAQLKLRRSMNGKPLKYCDVLARTLITAIRTSRRFSHYLEDEELRLAAALIPCFKLDWEKDETKRAELKDALIRRAERIELPSDESQTQHSQQKENDSQSQNTGRVADVEGDAEWQAEDEPEEVSAEDAFFGITPVAPASPAALETPEQEVERFLATRIPGQGVVSSFAKAPNGKRDFPRLAEMFLQLNTGLPSSASVERFFSECGRSFIALRNRLGDATLEIEVLLAMNWHYWDE